MCAAKAMGRWCRQGMELCNKGERAEALRLLGLALRQAVRLKSAMQEARVRNNMALVLNLDGRHGQARRQSGRALSLVAGRVGCCNRYHDVIQANHERIDADYRRMLEKAA